MTLKNHYDSTINIVLALLFFFKPLLLLVFIIIIILFSWPINPKLLQDRMVSLKENFVNS